MYKEEKHSGKALFSSLAIHTLLLLGCYFFFIRVEIPVEEIETGGIVINYGTSDEGMGVDYTSMDEPAIGPVISTVPIEDPNRPNSSANATSSNAEQDVLTQDMEDAPEVNDRTSSQNTSGSTSTESPAEKPPSVDQRAIFKGNRNSGTGGGDGTGNTPGNQGRPDGDPASTNYTGGSGSGGGIALNLSGRKFVSLPKIQDDGQTAGKITVDITVDKTGTIVTARAGGRGTTISNAALWSKCEKAVLGSKVNAIIEGPDIQAGSITFNFTLK